MSKPKVIAFYLPQYHPIPENDKWFGKGFTEWTNVGKAKPLFRGHYQPKVPADLGYYDLRLPEVREAQAELAKEAGIYGFCYWHYWFGNGKQLLERPFNEVLESGKPDFPFCLGWANHSWIAKNWDNRQKDEIIVEQLYPGKEDMLHHFNYLLKAFKDPRYIKIQGRPVFVVFDALAISRELIELWNKLAKENGFKDGICFIGRLLFEKDMETALNLGYNYVTIDRVGAFFSRHHKYWVKLFKLKNILKAKSKNCVSYKLASKYFNIPEIDSKKNVIPMLIPNWDHSPRSKKRTILLYNSTPELFSKVIKRVLEIIKHKNPEDQIILLKSWNEWGEGNYMEPDLKYGKGYIEVLAQALKQPNLPVNPNNER